MLSVFADPAALSMPSLLAQAAFLASPYKPFLMILPFIPWAWLVSSKIDKDARYFHLNVGLWNTINLVAGAGALAAMIFVPIFWIGWPLGMLVLAAPILVYWQHRNQEVPENQRFSLTGEGIGARLDARRQAKAVRDAVIQFTGADKKTRDVPMKEDPLFAVHMQAEDIIGPALDGRAAAVEMAVGTSNATIAELVDGVRYKRSMPAESALPVVDYLKELAGLDVKDRRRHQTGTFKMTGPQGGTELVATTAGSSSGLLLRLDFDRGKRLNKPFDNLGLLPSQREALGSLTEAHDRHGVVLVGAPSGHGLTTTMYSLIARHDAYTSNIKTLEREIFVTLDGVDHMRWDPTNTEIDYATQLGAMLRRDPDVLMLDLVKDTAAANVIAEPALQGPLLYVPQRANSVTEQIRHWVKIVGDVKKACKCLRAVMNQRLVRTLCPNCRQAYQPTADQLKKLNLPSKVNQLYRPSGKIQIKNKIENCPVCGGKGYLGQTGIFEVLLVDDDVRSLLSGGDLKAALSLGRRNKMVYLQEAGLSKVAGGETTVDEVVRVTTPARAETTRKPSSASKPSADPAPAS
ncbi:MAG: Flp pilus assembly complex ATPase component TadA [Phycisphaerales bacterium]|nr:Flp pilus assembly complex ATPase component TadA [Phycisphaerales bacterium]